MSEGTQRMTGGVSGTEQLPVSVAGGVGGAVTTEGAAGAVSTEGAPASGSATEQAVGSGQHVAGVAREQAAGVTSEARQQTRRLLDQAGGEVREQAHGQQQRLAGSLRSIGQELSSMTDGTVEPGRSGPATQMTRQLSEYSHQAADWLERREPGEVLDEVRRFARRRPGTFLAIAAVGGLVAGRLTRGLASSGQGGSTGRMPGNGWADDGSRYGTDPMAGAVQPGYGRAGYATGLDRDEPLP